MEAFLVLKWLHILSATVLFGTGIGAAFQMVRAMATGRTETVHSVASAVVLADRVFTTPAGPIRPATGLALVWPAGHALTEPRLVLTRAADALAFAWVPLVWLQFRIRDLAGVALAAGAPLPDGARRHDRMWFALGLPAFGALTGVFWLMVARPPLRG